MDKIENRKRILLLVLSFSLALVAGLYVVTLRQEEQRVAEEEQRVAEERNKAESRRNSYVQENPDLYSFTKRDILAGRIHLRMSKSDVIASLGEPKERISESQTIYGTRSSWTFELDYELKTLVFVNGALEGIYD